MGLKVVDGPQDLFDVEMGDIDGKATDLFEFIPKVSRIYRLRNERCREVKKCGLDGEERRCIPSEDNSSNSIPMKLQAEGRRSLL